MGLGLTAPRFWMGILRSPGGRLQLYLWLVMAGLLSQGIISLVLWSVRDRFAEPAALTDLFSANPPHAWLHITWGGLGLLLLLLQRGLRTTWWLGVVFGVFYTLLGVLGVAVHDPLGLRLGVGENGFHLIVGPLTLLLVALAAGESRVVLPRGSP
jgi:hypothetical protein